MLAHAFGQRYDSPVPLWLFVLGGGCVVVVSFAVVYRRGVDTAAQPPAEDVVPPRGPGWAGAASVGVLALLIAAGMFGIQIVAENILPTVFWVLVWVGLPLLVGVVGDFTGSLNPFAALSRAADNRRLRALVLNRPPLEWPRAAGFWVAVVAYLIVVVGELILNQSATLPQVTAAALLNYAILCAAGGLLFGAPVWNSHAEMFTVVFATWGRLGWFRFRAPGAPGFGGGLAVPFEASLSRLVTVLLLLVSVMFDGLLTTRQWAVFVSTLPVSARRAGAAPLEAVSFGALVVLTVIVIVVLGGFATLTVRAAGHRQAMSVALHGLLPSLMPISFAYLLAHYLQYIVINGQSMFGLLGNPIGSDTWPVRLPYPFNGEYVVDTAIMPTSVVWYVQVVVIIAAHIGAVVLAHRHLHARVGDPALARRSEWPWLVAMVGYTMISLWLLAQPVLAENAPPTQAAAIGAPR